MSSITRYLLKIIDTNPRLNIREKQVLRLRSEGKTLEQTGRYFGVTRERIRQVEAKAMRKLFFYYNKFIESYDDLKEYQRLKELIELKKVTLKQQMEQESGINTELEFLEELPFETRTIHALQKAGIYNTNQLKDYYLLQKHFTDIRNIGVKANEQVISYLKKAGKI